MAITSPNTWEIACHIKQSLYLWLQCIYGYMDLFLWRLKGSLQIVCFLLTIIRDGQSKFSHLKGTSDICLSSETKQRLCYIRVDGFRAQVVELKTGTPVACNIISVINTLSVVFC